MLFSRTAALHYPAGSPPRIAVLGPCFRQSRGVRVFREGWSAEVAAFRPSAIAGTLDRVLDAADAGLELSHAVIVLHRPGESLLTAEDRERIWRAFHVPVFEQIVGERGRLLAGECEAHDGPHIHSAGASRDGYLVEAAPCACGLKSPRLTRPEPAERIRSAAMYAR